VLSYVDVLRHDAEVGEKVAIIGAGGIGFDVAEFLAHAGKSTGVDVETYQDVWGVDAEYREGGGLKAPEDHPPKREITMCQRSEGKLGAKLGKTTGWIHRASMKKLDVEQLAEVQYDRIDDAGLHIKVAGKPRVLDVDHVIVCAGQVPKRDLAHALEGSGAEVHLIGGADVAAELDAKRAIDQGARLAARL
jgi:2,4-dienoyl-CoA reductase (NADPH2)